MDTFEQIESTVAWLREKSAAYYRDGSSDVSDAEYDLVLERLRGIVPGHIFFSEVGSPPTDAFRAKIKHEITMLSLNKATTSKELGEWLNRAAEEDFVIVQPKVDGASIELFYKGGLLQWAATRGDGITGEDVTVAARKTVGIPAKILYTGDFWVRGEIYLPKSKWAEVDPEMKTNPRNVGTGILNRLDGSDADKLHFMAFSCHSDDSPLTESRGLDFLNLQGIQVAETVKVQTNLVLIEGAIEQLREHRPNLEYAIDGAVIKFDSLIAQKMLGTASGRPRGQIAFKWQSETVETVLKGVTLTVGHTGYIAPTAQLEPVKLMGVTISNALLNNWDEIARLGVAINDVVIVERSGEIIPKIIGVASRPDNRIPIAEPKVCPVCGGTCQRAVSTSGESGAITVCINSDCSSRQIGLLKRWIKSLNILGIGDDTLESMFSSNLVRKRIDLYSVLVEELAAIRVGNGVLGVKRAEEILREVEKTKGSLSISHFMGSLGIPYLGTRKAAIMQDLAGGQLSTLEQWTGDNLLAMGTHVQAGGTASFMHASIQKNLGEIKDLAALTLKPVTEEAPQPAEESGEVVKIYREKHVFLLTGKFNEPKSVYHKLITDAGQRYLEDWHKDVTILVQADPNSSSSKTKKAIKAGVPVIGIDDLKLLLS